MKSSLSRSGHRRSPLLARSTAAVMQRLEPRRLLSAGDLDPTFSDDGKQVIDLAASSNEIANAVTVQSDGKIVLAGRFTGPSEADFAIVRLNADGTIDTSFGGGDGLVTIDFAINDEAMDVAIDSAGRIVVAGTSSSGAGSNARNFAVARLTPAGALDTSFSGDGKLIIDFGTNDDAQALAIHAGAIYVAGYKDIGTTGQFALARLTSAGTLDTTFSGDGMVTFAFGGNNDSRCYDIAVQPDGKIVMVGYDENLSAPGHTRNLAVARLGTNALLDPSFSGDGLFTLGVNLDDELRAVGVDFKGRIVAGGFTDPVNAGEDFVAIRLLGDGTLDTSFNTDGVFTADLGNADTCQDLALQPDGTITLSGNTLGSGFQAAVVQIQPFSGLPSTSFGDGGDGIQLIDFGTLDQGFAIAHTSDLRTVIAGTDGSGKMAVGRLRDLIDTNFVSPTVSSVFYERMVPLPDGKIVASGGFHVRRLLPDGSVDPTFSAITTPIAALDLAVDNAGRIVVLLQQRPSGGALEVLLRRYRANGTPDTSFSGDGQMSFLYNPPHDSLARAIAIDSANRIVVAGYTEGIEDAERTAVARVTSGGSLDPSFDGDGVNVLNLNLLGLDRANDVVIQPADGKIILVGSDGFNAYAMRLNTDGSRDGTFAGADGIREFDIGVGNFLEALAVTLDGSGRLVIGGYVERTLQTESRGFVARITPTGQMDSTFNGNGRLALQFSPHGEHITGIALDSLGNIVTHGYVQHSTDPSDDRILVRKLFASGSGGVFTFGGDGAWIAPFAPRGITLRPRDVIAGGAIYVGGGERLLRLNMDPAVTDFEFAFERAPQQLRVQFNDDIGASLAPGDLQIRNTTTSSTLPASAYTIASFDPLRNTARVHFNTILADGDYTVTFSATGITNNQGIRLSGNRTRDFFFLQGDANRDRRVNLADFNIVAANFGRADRGFSQGDFSYDGVVNLADFNILASRFGRALAPEGMPLASGGLNVPAEERSPVRLVELVEV